MLNKGSDLIQAFQILSSERERERERERTAAVQWEPAGRSNRAIPLGVTQRTTAASLSAPARSRWTDRTLQNKVHH